MSILQPDANGGDFPACFGQPPLRFVGEKPTKAEY